MNSHARVPAAVAALGLALTLTGCGGSDASSGSAPKPSASKTSAAAPATGNPVKGTGYSYTAPKGWRPPSQKVPGLAPDTFIGDPSDKDGFTDNINVIVVDPAPVDDIGTLEKGAKKELEGAHATDIKLLDRQQVDGTAAVHLTSGFRQNNVKYLVDQFSMIHDKVIYTVTFSFSATVTPEKQDELAQSVLSTWKWGSDKAGV
jgi:hypothetical protein